MSSAPPPLVERDGAPNVYACWHKDSAVRRRSSSGGAFSAIAELILEAGGVVFGAAYDNNLHVRHLGVENMDNLDCLRRSKYVQSEIGRIFKEVRDHLLVKRQVLFVGTPCQVSGLYGYLGRDYVELLTVDFICHGVPSPALFKKYTVWLQSFYGSKMKDLNFRDKRKGWENAVMSATWDTGYSTQLKGRKRSFHLGFISGLILRRSCFHCKFMKIPRPGDFTIADFWGIGERDHFSYQKEKQLGISLLIVNSTRKMYSTQWLEDKVTLVERSFQEAARRNIHLFNPVEQPERRNELFREAGCKEYEYLERNFLRPSLKNRIIQGIKDNCRGSVISRLRKVRTAKTW